MILNRQSEIDVMLFLKKAGGLTGFPLSNLVTAYRLPADQLLETLKQLETHGLIKVTGERTLDDLEERVESQKPFGPAVQIGRHSYQTDNHRLFNEKSDGYFKTSVRLTLRGHMAVTFLKSKKKNEYIYPKTNDPRVPRP